MVKIEVQDIVGAKKPEDLERKYNLSGLQKSLELNKNSIVRIDTVQKNLLDLILLSLKGFDAFGDIELWFYQGTPGLNTKPYTDWVDPSTHHGDLYYDKDSGKVYQFNNEWVVQTEKNFIQAMAITNAEIDTADNHRKAFLSIPQPPYDNGDWYIKDEQLYICQLSKIEGQPYEENDFIVASQYVKGTIATKLDNEIKVVAGQVLTIKESVDSFVITLDTDYYTKTEIDTNGVSKVKTSTGFLFNETGLTISKSGKPISTTITEDGVIIKKNGVDTFIANATGLKIIGGTITGSTGIFGDITLDNRGITSANTSPDIYGYYRDVIFNSYKAHFYIDNKAYVTGYCTLNGEYLTAVRRDTSASGFTKEATINPGIISTYTKYNNNPSYLRVKLEDGKILFSSDFSANGTYLEGLSDYSFRVSGNNGYIDIGPKNTGTCHIYTDRPSFYFNKNIYFPSDLNGYNGVIHLKASSYCYVWSNDGLTVVDGTNSYYTRVKAAGFDVVSNEKYKTNIVDEEDGAIEKLMSLKIRNYHLKNELLNYDKNEKNELVVTEKSKNTLEVKKRKGLIIEETTDEVIFDNKIDLYSLLSLAIKGIQELNNKVNGIYKIN